MRRCASATRGKIETVLELYKPDTLVVAMGTNDFQSMRIKRKWVRFSDPRWSTIYADRVDEMLRIMSGPDRKRLVIWVGPTAFPRKNSRRFGPHISAIIKKRVAAFAGPAHYIDAFAATSDDKHKPLNFIKDPTTGRRVKVRGRDDIHLTHSATRLVMTLPVTQLLEACWVRSEHASD